MPRGKKFGGKNFEKGHPGGPGRPPISPELKKIRTMDRGKVEEIVRQYWDMDELSAAELIASKGLTLGERLVLRSMLDASLRGDTSKIAFFTDFMFGERPKHIKFSGGLVNASGEMSKTETLAALKKLNEEF